jgi:hypothetical protein
MGFRDETLKFHQQRMKELQVNITHLEGVVIAHNKVADEPGIGPEERAYARTSALRSQRALDQMKLLLNEFQRGAINFSILTEDAVAGRGPGQ